MNMIIQITTAIAMILSIIVPFGYFFLGEKSKKRYKKSLIANCFMFFGVLLVATVVSFAGTASVQAAGSSADGLATGLGYLGAALVTGISGLGSGIAVASSASAALGALSEDGSLFGKSIIFVAMAEGIALYGLIISFMILGKLEGALPMKMYLISDNIDTYTGMRLAGVEGVVIHERNELKNALEQAISDKEIGIILLTEKFGREFPEIIDEVRLHHKTPLIIEIPDRHGTGRKPDFITSYVNEAIGLKV